MNYYNSSSNVFKCSCVFVQRKERSEMSIEYKLEATLNASKTLGQVSRDLVDKVITDVANDTVLLSEVILSANACDLAHMDNGNPAYDRLLLTEQRLISIADDLKKVALLPSPLGKVISEKILSNGLNVRKITVPLGVVGIIYEARPNVTFDVFALCLKSGNSVLLKGGSDAQCTNEVIVEVIKRVLKRHGINPDAVNLLPPGRETAAKMLNAVGFVDVIIPRGSQALIDYVRRNSSIPVLETGAGICHTYFDESGDCVKGQQIITNAKTRRVSVCNALDCLVIHQSRLADLPFLCEKLADKNVVIYADHLAYNALLGSYPKTLLQPAKEAHFGTEFLDYKMAIKTVRTFGEAVLHISSYSSKHSEAIISEDERRTDDFLKEIDASVVYANTSTAFTDGAQLGLGAEIGISTQKLHARGPMGLGELTSYKWLIKGNGQVREP